VHGQIRLANIGTAGFVRIFLHKNGAAVENLYYGQTLYTTTTVCNIQISTPPVSVSDGDYFQLGIQYAADTSVDIIAADSAFAIEAVEATRLDQHRSAFSTISSSSGTLTVNLDGYEYFKTTLTENVSTVTVSGVTSGVLNRFEIRVAQDGTGGRTWANPASWKFPGGTAYTPSAAASAVDILRGRTYDGGTTWEVEFNKGYA
jgi:hypothetical protein